MVRVGVLGPLVAWRGEEEVSPGQPRQRAVLGVLASRANHVVSRGELVDAVWGNRSPTSAEGGIYTYVAGLRRVLEPQRGRRDPGRVLVSAGAGYMLRLDEDSLDAAVFERGLARARRVRTQGDLPAAARSLRDALGLWRGIAFAGVPGPFADAERQRLAELRTSAAEELADVLIAQGNHEEALPDLTVLVAEHPMRERARGLLMVALYRCGRQADALQAFRDARDALAEELGIDPGSELSRIHQQVLAMDPALDSPESGAVTAAVVAPPRPQHYPRARMTGDVGIRGAPAQIPLEIAGFAGRHTEIAGLHAMLPGTTGQRSVPVAVITGMAGVGKTALAVKFARQASGRFPDGQLYVNLRGYDPSGAPLEPPDVLRGFFDALEVPPKRVPESVEGQIGLFRSLLEGRRMLLVLDNARTTEQVRPLLPGSPGCMVVITSRSRLAGLIAAEGARPVPLDVLTSDEARDMLTGRLGSARITAESGATGELIGLCGNLPLALSVASARAATHSGLTLAGLAEELRDTQARLDALDSGDEATTNLRAVFSWSYQQLSEPAARMFRLLGLLNGADFPASVASSLAGVTQEEARAAIAELTRASLLAEPTPGRFAFHDLLRAYAAEQARAADDPDELAAARLRLLDYYLRSMHAASARLYPMRGGVDLPDPVAGVTAETFRAYEQSLAWIKAERPAIMAALADAAGQHGLEVYCWQLPWLMAQSLMRFGRRRDYLATQQIALAAAERTGDKVALEHAHHEFASASSLTGDSDKAHEHFGKALELATALGDKAGEAHVHYGLAIELDRKGRYEEALAHSLESLRLRRAYADRSAVAHSENAVGWLYSRLGQYSEALRHCRRSLEMSRECGSRPLTADILDSLGFIYDGLGDREQAITHYLQSVAVYREIGDVNCVIGTLARLGDARQAASQHDLARDAWQQAMAIGRDVPGFDITPLSERLSGLGSGKETNVVYGGDVTAS